MTAIHFERRGPVAVACIDRPSSGNAIDVDASRDLSHFLRMWENDEEIAAAVVTATGDVFCGGADDGDVARGMAAELMRFDGQFAGIARARRRKPLVAAVNGPADAAGLEIVLACDLVVADATATFALSEVQSGGLPGSGGLVRLPEIVGARRAAEMALLGDPIDAEKALAWGLVNRVVEPGRCVECAVDMAAQIAGHPQLAVREVLPLLELATGTGWDALIWAHERNAWERVHRSGTPREAARQRLDHPPSPRSERQTASAARPALRDDEAEG